MSTYDSSVQQQQQQQHQQHAVVGITVDPSHPSTNPSHHHQGAHQQRYDNNNDHHHSGAAAPQHDFQHDHHDDNFITGIPLYDSEENPTLKNRFVTDGYKDIWAAVMFLLGLGFTVIAAIVNGPKHSHHHHAHADSGNNNHYGSQRSVFSVLTHYGGHHKTGNVHHFPTAVPSPGHGSAYGESAGKDEGSLAVFLPVICIVATLLASGSLLLMRSCPKEYIWGANIVLVVLNIIIALVALMSEKYFTAVMWILFAAINALWLYLVRDRIPFAATILRTAVSTVARFYGSIVTSAVALVCGALYYLLFLFAIPVSEEVRADTRTGPATTSTGSQRNDGGASAGAWITFLFYALLFFWTLQVIVNVVHVTTSGTVATWYFVGSDAMPKNPSVASLKRALTTSFGSICFGSLVVAILKLIHFLVRMSMRHGGDFVQCVALCIISCIEYLMEYFNVYAFTHIAIYGTSYIDAAKQTWAMMKQCGWYAYFNDNLIFPVLNLTTFFNSAGLGIVFGFVSHNAVVGVLGFIISWMIHMVVFRVVFSGVVTIFVCVAECPEVLDQNHPALKQAIEGGAAKQPSSSGRGEENRN